MSELMSIILNDYEMNDLYKSDIEFRKLIDHVQYLPTQEALIKIVKDLIKYYERY